MSASSRSSGSPDMISLGDVLFLLALVFFLAVVCVWPVLAWRIHHFSTYFPTGTHSYPVHDRLGATVYLNPVFGKFYVSLPWLWCTAFVATVVASLLTSRKKQD
ncbi:MAG TPA: hypothetical protein VGJ06_16470 [Candidatus Acidoferrum sp.]